MAHLLVELGVEKRSIAGAELMVPPIVETGEESVVTALGFFWSSFRRCSFDNENEDQQNILFQFGSSERREICGERAKVET